MSRESEPRHEEPGEGAAGGLASRSFLGLLTAQFLGAVNDNMFRWLVVPIGKEMVSEEQASLALAVGLICFVLPYLLLAATAGYLADRFSKRTVIVGCKVAELVMLIMGVGAILSGSLWLMFGVVFLLGAQSALFGPSKFGSIPEIVRSDRISAANGLIGMTTVVAIVAGSGGGACLYELTAPAGRPSSRRAARATRGGPTSSRAPTARCFSAWTASTPRRPPTSATRWQWAT